MEDFIMNGMLFSVGKDPVSANPNNCSTCCFKAMESEGGWCYMFRDEPTSVCMQHSGRELIAPRR